MFNFYKSRWVSAYNSKTIALTLHITWPPIWWLRRRREKKYSQKI
jgi:hypothetical protein